MSIKREYTKAKLNLDIGYQTTCKHCGTAHGGLYYCGFDSGMCFYLEASEVVGGRAKKLINTISRQLARGERGSLCPACHAIDPVAQARFGAEDTAEFIYKRFKYYTRRNLIFLLLFLGYLIGVAVTAVEIAYYLDAPHAANPAPIVITLVASAAVLLLTLYRCWFGRLKTAWGILADLSEDELRNLLDILYQESGEDLRLWILAGSKILVNRHAQPWAGVRLNPGVTCEQHYPPLETLRGGQLRRLRQAAQFAQDMDSLYQTGKRHPRPPAATRTNGGPGRWNWFYGHGTLLTSMTPASKQSEQVLQNLLQELRVLERKKLIASSTVVTVRMKPATREWGVLIVNPRHAVEEEPLLQDEDEEPMGDDYPLPFVALEHHHQFRRREVHPPQVFEWAKEYAHQVVAPMEFADESRTISV